MTKAASAKCENMVLSYQFSVKKNFLP